MLERVKKTIQTHELIDKGDKVLVGVSGGADSVALLYALNSLSGEMGFELCAAHLNHGIRGESAKRDEKYVIALCEKLCVPLEIGYADIPLEAKRKSQTIEQAARNIRYEFLESVREKFGAKSIAVAHHKNDQAESILLHMFRGSGLSGLVGIKYVRGNIIRPFLDVSRNDIEKYLEKNNIEYCTDETNLELDARRNKLRLELIPYIEENINPRIIDCLCENARLLLDDEDYIERKALELLENARVETGYSRSILLKGEKPVLSRALRAALRENGVFTDIEKKHIDMLIKLLGAKTGTRINIKHISAYVSYDIIAFTNDKEILADEEATLVINGITKIADMEVRAFLVDEYKKGDNCAYIDYDKVKGEIKVRRRRNGDRFYPVGAPGAKKLKDWFIDKKIPQTQRNMLMICSENNVLYIPRFCISQLVRVDSNTKRILKIEFARYVK